MHPIPVFVINLKRDTERLAFMQKQLDKINISFEVIPAIDGHSIPCEQLEKIYDPELAMRKGRSLHPEEIGCWMSHIKAWRTMLERDLPAALILEDDVLLDDDFPEIFRNLRLPAECQALQLATVHKWRSFRNNVFSPYGAASLPNGWKMACNLGETYGTQGYIIRQEMARRLLREEGRLQRPVDFVLFCWQYNFCPPWIVYKKEKQGMYTALGEEKRFLGLRSILKSRRRYHIEKSVNNIQTGIQRTATDSAGDKNLPALVIHLKKDAQRLAAMQQRFDAMGLSFETVEAVDGSRISAQTLHKMYDGKRARKNLDRELSPAEIGRCLSHSKAWRALLNTDAPAAAIVEDSAVPADDFPKFLRYSGDLIPFSGGRAKRGVFRWMHVFAPPPPPVPLPHDYRPPIDEEIKRLKPKDAALRFQTQAYIIHRSRARRLLRRGRRIQRPVDELLFHKKRRLKQILPGRSKKYFWDAVTLFNAQVLCRIFPPAANKLSMLEGDDPPRAGVRQKFKIMLSCYSLSRPFGLNLSKRKTGEPAQE